MTPNNPTGGGIKPWTRSNIEGLFNSGNVDAILDFIRSVNSIDALQAENELLAKEKDEQYQAFQKWKKEYFAENKRLREFIAHVHKDKCECPNRGNEGCFHWADRCRAEILSAGENKEGRR